jgi:hypothetical protein
MEWHLLAIELLQDLEVSMAGLSSTLSQGLPENVAEHLPPQPWNPEESPSMKYEIQSFIHS